MAAADLGAAEWERSKISTQDVNLLKKLGISKKPKALCFPSEESYPTPPMGYRVSFVDHLIRGLSAPIHPFLRGLLFVYGLQLHHLTPNSILHISIFITLCEAFLGVQPNWALWKRIFFCRRNGSPNVTYNIGGVVIYVRPTVDYFDVKLPDSVQGWRKKWLYIQEENHGCAEDNIPPFDGAEKILRRRSWDADATEEERASTETLMARIHELQNTRGKELSGIQITAYFLRTRVQPLQARKYPLWKYAGDKDVDRLSVDLEVKDLERLVRKISSLSKKDAVPSSCRVTPFSAANPLPENHPNLVSLPPLPEGGEVEERAIVTDDNEETPSFVNEPVDSQKSAGSSEGTASGNLLLPLFLQKAKGKGKALKIPALLKPKKLILRIRRQLMIHILRPSSAQNLQRPTGLPTLFQKLEQSETARKKAELDASQAKVEADEAKAKAASVEELQKKLDDAEADQTNQDFDLENPTNDPLLDALSYLEFHGQEIREGVVNADQDCQVVSLLLPKKEEPKTFLALAKDFNPPEDLGLKMRQENMKVAVENTIALVADSQQTVTG
ncbi:hypothetical protein QYE76_012225 [Lolium multiflorum]|uniref:Transposase (putative) gypsy type domain-containing protein n=1 Tax=Lolium multiflorum TaxID=4521 RepID=A0AAD8U0C5_LOLMU|nr:hypothetical protein QYE76_012225 [Lolium multiflorum]